MTDKFKLKKTNYFAMKKYREIQIHSNYLMNLMNDLYLLDENLAESIPTQAILFLEAWTKEKIGLIRAGYDPYQDRNLSYLCKIQDSELLFLNCQS